MPDNQIDIQSSTRTIKDTSSYRSIFKATSLFGGLQVYKILIGIIKSKFVAVLLGPAGMGIMGLFQTTLELIKSFSSFGLEYSAVREISEASGSGDSHKISVTFATLRRLVWFTGLLGLVITTVFSPVLSRLTFGDNDYTWAFVILASTLLIDQVCAGQRVLLQGMRRLKDLVKATAIGATIGLIISIPLYYWIGIKGIVPTMVITSLTAMGLSWFYSRKIDLENKSVTIREAFANGRTMIKMGVAMSISNILVALLAYVLRWFIRSLDGVDAVGIFTAGFVIVEYYVGMVFTAMGTDYYPRLAAVNKDNNKCIQVVNQQGEVAVLILAPLIVSCIILMPFIIRVIYTDKFLLATEYISWAIIGMMFKTASYVIAYLFLAKAESRIFIYNETFSNIRSLTFNLLGYYFWGITGLGIAFLINNICYLTQVYIISRKKYGFRFQRSFLIIYFVQFSYVLISFIITKIWNSPLSYIPLVCILSICIIFSWRELDKRMNLISIIKSRMN